MLVVRETGVGRGIVSYPESEACWEKLSCELPMLNLTAWVIKEVTHIDVEAYKHVHETIVRSTP